MTERELIVPLRQERELQRRVKELEEALRKLLLRIDEQATYGDEIKDAIRQAESLLSNSGAPQKETKLYSGSLPTNREKEGKRCRGAFQQ